MKGYLLSHTGSASPEQQLKDSDCSAGSTCLFKQQIEESGETTEIKHLTQEINLFQDSKEWYSLPSTRLLAASLRKAPPAVALKPHLCPDQAPGCYCPPERQQETQVCKEALKLVIQSWYKKLGISISG